MKTLAARLRLLPARVNLPPKKAAPLYASPEWRSLIASIIAERGRRCEDPAHDPARPRAGVRLFGDHIRELADGGALLDRRNIMLLCGACHSRKTAAARARRQGDGGFPSLSPTHE